MPSARLEYRLVKGAPGWRAPRRVVDRAGWLDSAPEQCFTLRMAKAKSNSSKKLTKSALLQSIVDKVGDGASRKGVKAVLDALTEIGHKELKKNGIFVLPGFAKFVVVKKPARPARKGINPFTRSDERRVGKGCGRASVGALYC